MKKIGRIIFESLSFMRKGYPIYTGKEGGLLPQIKGMLFLSSIGHIILFVLIIYLSLRFHQYQINPRVYNVNLVDFIGEKELRKSTSKINVKEPLKKISPPPVVKKKPKKIKKTALKKSKPLKKKAKKAEKRRVAIAKKKKSEESKKRARPTKTLPRKITNNPPPLIASQGNAVNLGGSYRGSLTLDNANFPFTYYLLLIRDKISENWNPNFVPPPLVEGQQVIIVFQIQKDGSISKPHIEKTSGIAYLDQSALRAVLSSVPFPPLPREFGEDFLGIHFGFEYVKEG